MARTFNTLATVLGLLVATSCVTPYDIKEFSTAFNGLAIDTFTISYKANRVNADMQYSYFAKPNYSVAVYAGNQVIRRTSLNGSTGAFEVLLKPEDVPTGVTEPFPGDTSIAWVPIVFALESRGTSGQWAKVATLRPQTIQATGDGKLQTIKQWLFLIGLFPSSSPSIGGAQFYPGAICVLTKQVSRTYDSDTGLFQNPAVSFDLYNKEPLQWLSDDPVVFY